MAKEKTLVENKDVVAPGEVLAKGMNYLPGKKAFREGERICSSVLGLADVRGRVIKVIPLSGAYMPKKNDVIIGKIRDLSYAGWKVNTSSPYPADLNIGEVADRYIDLDKVDLSEILDIGDYIFAKIKDISESKYIKLTIQDKPYKELKEGTIMKVSPTKVPRVIGKKGSMVKMMKRMSGCDILVGQNGLVWIHGEPEKEELVVKAIGKIEEESHKEGLTDKIKKMLKDKNGKERKTKKSDS